MPPLSRRKGALASSSKETIPEENENEKLQFPYMTFDQFTEYTNVIDIVKSDTLRKFPNRLNDISSSIKGVYQKYIAVLPSFRQRLIKRGFQIAPKPWITKADRERKKWKIKECSVLLDPNNIAHITGKKVAQNMRNKYSSEKQLQEELRANFPYYVKGNIKILAALHGGLDKAVEWLSRNVKYMALKSNTASCSEVNRKAPIKRKPGPLSTKTKPRTKESKEIKLSKEKAGPSSKKGSRTKSPCPELSNEETKTKIIKNRSENAISIAINKRSEEKLTKSLRYKARPKCKQISTLVNEKMKPDIKSTTSSPAPVSKILELFSGKLNKQPLTYDFMMEHTNLKDKIASKIEELYPNLEAGDVQQVVKKYIKTNLCTAQEHQDLSKLGLFEVNADVYNRLRRDVTEINHTASNKSEVNNAHGTSSQTESKGNSVCSEVLQTGDKGEVKADQMITVGKKRKNSDCSSTQSKKKSRQTIEILPTDICFEDFRRLTDIESVVRNDILRKFPATCGKYLAKIEKFINRYYVRNFLKSSIWPKEIKIHDKSVRTMDDFVKFKIAWSRRRPDLDVNKNAASDLEINREPAPTNKNKEDFVITHSAVASDELHPSPELFPSSANTDEKLNNNSAKSLTQESPILEIVNVDNISFTQGQNFENCDPLSISLQPSVETQNLENTKTDEYILISVLNADAHTVTEIQSEELCVTHEFDAIAVTEIQSEQVPATQEFGATAVIVEQLSATQEFKCELYESSCNERQSSTHESESSVVMKNVKRQRNLAEIVQEKVRALDILNSSIKNENPVEFEINKDPFKFGDLNFGPTSGNKIIGDFIEQCMLQSLGSSSASNIQLAFEVPANPIETISLESVRANFSRENSIRSTRDETVRIKKEVIDLDYSQYEDEVEIVPIDRETTIIITDETPDVENLLAEMMNNNLDSDNESSEIMSPTYSPLKYPESDHLVLMDVSPVESEEAMPSAFQRSPADTTKVANGEAIQVRNEEPTPVQNGESIPVRNEATPNTEIKSVRNVGTMTVSHDEGASLHVPTVINENAKQIPIEGAISPHFSKVRAVRKTQEGSTSQIIYKKALQKSKKRQKSTASKFSTRTKRGKNIISGGDLATSLIALQNKHSFEPLDFVGNSKMVNVECRPFSSKQPNNTIGKRKSIDRDYLIEDPSLDNIGTPVKQRSMTVSQILNTDESYLNNLQDPSVGNSHSFAVGNSETCAEQVAVHETSNNRNSEIIEKLPHFFFNQKYNCITDLSLHQVAESTHITYLHYISKVPFLEPIERKPVQAIITFRNDGFNRLIIKGDSLKFELGLSDMKWECFLNLLQVLDAFENTPISIDPIDKSLPVRVLSHQFKTLPKFSQIALEYANFERHVKSTVDYLRHIDSLAEAFICPERQVPSHIDI